MEQQRALNALEPFLALSKSASSPRAAADLITQATSAPNTYIFSELLQTPNIQALRNSPDHLPSLRLLEIFAWGSYAQYQAIQSSAAPNLPDLNLQQTQKLRLLSLLPLCASPQTQSYTALQTALALPTSPPDDIALESLITQAIYSNLLTAHLDPLHRTVRVTSVAPLRDPAPGSVSAMLAALSEWEDRCNDTLKGIEDEIAQIKARAASEKQVQQRRKTNFETALENFSSGDDGTGGGAGGAGDPGVATHGGGGGGGSSGKTRGFGWNKLTNKGGKRAAPMDNASGSHSAAADAMDIDDLAGGDATGSKGATRATKRKGITTSR